MKDDIKTIVMIILILEIVLLLYILTIGLIGSVGMGTGCFLRYSNGVDTGQSVTQSLQVTASVRADGNYSKTNINTTVINGQQTQTKTVSDDVYGQWQRINAYLPNNTSYDIKIVGTISLCRAYLPLYNLGSDTNKALDANGNPYLIPIPRIEETNVPPLKLVLDAKTSSWKNITEIFPGDQVEVMIDDDVAHAASGNLSTITAPNAFIYPYGTNFPTVNCQDGAQKYSPICGRWSFWNGQQSYINNCEYRYGRFPGCPSECCDEDAFGTCWSWLTGSGGCYSPCHSNLVHSGSLPVPYSSQANLIIPNAADVHAILGEQCTTGCSAGVVSCSAACRADVTCATKCDSQSCINACSDPSKCSSDISKCKATSCLNSYNVCTANCNDSNNPTCSNNCLSTYTSCCSNKCNDNVSGCITGCQNTSIDTCKQQCSNNCTNSGCSSFDPKAALCVPLSNVTPFNNAIQNYKYWFSATNANGLVWRLDTSQTPSNATQLGSGYNFASLIDPNSDTLPDANSARKIYSNTSISPSTKYLQYLFYDPRGAAYYAQHTGGYVFGIKHTKCRRVNGATVTDSVENRGQILYTVTTGDPNLDPHIPFAVANPDNTGSVYNLNTGDNTSGSLWIKIYNNPSDYPDSSGQYTVQLFFNIPQGSFSLNILNPLFTYIRTALNDAAQMVFQNLICYQQTPTSTCQNLFSYIKAMLTMYIALYGMMFLTGMVTLSQRDLVIRVVKVGLVAGLINGNTFEWFNTYLFDFLTGFTDQMISNMSGFSLLSASNTISNPFMFLDSMLSKIFFGQTFWAQLFGVLGMGLVGLLYFLIICVGVVIFIIVAMKSIAIYVMAMVAIAFLISMSPIFLTFMLFEKTFYLFENWCNFIFRYMMEPVILMLGVIVLTQLFTLYIDQVLGFSVCWKCAIGFSLPFAGMLPFPGLADMPLFCVNWFGPWGIDPSTFQPGMDLVNIIGLIIVTFTAYGWSEFAGKISQNLSNANGPGATEMGLSMAHAKGQQFLKKFGLDEGTRGQLNQQKAARRQDSRDALKTREKDIAKQEQTLKNRGISIGSEDSSQKDSNSSAGAVRDSSNTSSSRASSSSPLARPDKSAAVQAMQKDLVNLSQQGKETISGPSVDRSTKPQQAPDPRRDLKPQQPTKKPETE